MNETGGILFGSIFINLSIRLTCPVQIPCWIEILIPYHRLSAASSSLFTGLAGSVFGLKQFWLLFQLLSSAFHQPLSVFRRLHHRVSLETILEQGRACFSRLQVSWACISEPTGRFAIRGYQGN